ncbi:hypothetical protein AB0I28_21210 [Phytomonospora sp. NPDC050363]|uniref:hypothetical protein n=1 Tax=Phytomonospora sp. NPDC050363 TaxID=3155642 RepID=UPI0033F0DD10
MPGPNLHRHVAVYKGYIAGGGFSYTLLGGAAFLLLLAWVAGVGVLGWLVVLVLAGVLVLLSGLRRRAVVRMDLYTVRIRNVLLPGAGRRVPVRSIRTVRIIETTPQAAQLLRWLPGARRSVLLRSGPAVELELTTGASEILGLDEPFEASRTLRRFHAETTGKELPEDVLDEDEAFYLWRRNRRVDPRRAATGKAGAKAGKAGKPGKVPAQGGKAAGKQGAAAAKQNAAKQAAAKQGAAKQAAAKQAASKQAASKQSAARQNAAKADVARRAAQQAKQQRKR